MKMFPKTKWVGKVSVYKQLWHLLTEVWEVFKALVVGDLEAAKMELIDVKHSADSLLHMLGVSEGEHIRLCDKIERKNFYRGYYKREG